MELRKVEQELEVLSSEWKTLRRKQPKFDDDTSSTHSNEALYKIIPSWKDLKAKVNDDELFPPYEEDEYNGEDDDMIKDVVVDGVNQDENDKDTNNNTEDAPTDADDTGGYSEFGMCIVAPSCGNEEESKNKNNTESSITNGGSIFERYAAKNTVPAKSKVSAPQKQTTRTSTEDESSDEEDEMVEDASPEDVLARLESLHGRFNALEPKIDKFKAKLRDRDPVTKKTRYGEKTLPRVMNVIRKYKALEDGVEIVFRDAATGSTCLVSSLRIQVQQHTEQVNAKIQARRSQEQLEAERTAKEKKLAEEEADKQRLLEEQKKREEEKELARRAEEARIRRLEEEQRVLDAERQEDEELLALVPTLGVDGVREQIDRMREALKDDNAALAVALGSLYTLFEQIVRKPEEINFRRVRRDHPKFIEDIGRHVGGREVLVAAGFTLEKLDGVPCFFSKEPHIESDMDGWSDWFDKLKKTLAIIEEEMMK